MGQATYKLEGSISPTFLGTTVYNFILKRSNEQEEKIDPSLNLKIPDTNRLLTKETRYPEPTSSNSTPLRVVPSQLNCAAIVPCDPGPSDN